MKPDHSISRYNLLLFIILGYFLPLLGISLYGALVPRQAGDWNILGIGFFLTAFGSLAFYWMLSQWDGNNEQNFFVKGLNEQVDASEYELAKRSLEEAQQSQMRLLSEIDVLSAEIQKTKSSKEETFHQTERVQSELEETRRDATRQLEMQQNQIRELQETIANQKSVNEKKQQQIILLETKVGDLTNEIKTLLKFAEAYSSPVADEVPKPELPLERVNEQKIEAHAETGTTFENFAQNSREASMQLRQCLDIAQKIKASQRFGSQIYSFLDSPADVFSLDLRRLCDRLRSEAHSAILLYSPNDNQMLFASNQIKALTGWSPEKFVQYFSEILVEGSEWKQGVNSLSTRSEAEVVIHLKTRSGPALAVKAHLGMIPTGIFRNHTIAILYPGVTEYVHT